MPVWYGFVFGVLLTFAGAVLLARYPSPVFTYALAVVAGLTVLFFLLNMYLLFFTLSALLTGAPFVPTPPDRAKKMLALAQLLPKERLLDLGSGDGRLLYYAARLGACAIGIERHPALYWLTRWRIFRLGYPGIAVIRGNFWVYNFSPFDVLTVYLVPSRMEQLMMKVRQEMKPGSRIVSYEFPFPGWQPMKKDGNIYLYIV